MAGCDGGDGLMVDALQVRDLLYPNFEMRCGTSRRTLNAREHLEEQERDIAEKEDTKL